jgi:hypothetical protein
VPPRFAAGAAAHERSWHIKTITVFTRSYRPFIMGGNVNAPVSADVEASGPFDLGQGFSGYLVVAPNGKTFVAEAESGGFVGPTIAEVKADIASCDDIAMMRTQVKENTAYGKAAQKMPAYKFWALLKCSAGGADPKPKKE